MRIGEYERKRREQVERRRKGKGEETKQEEKRKRLWNGKNPLLGFFAGIIFLKFSRTAFKFMLIQIFEDSTALFLRFLDFCSTFVRLRCEMALLRPIRFRF